MLLKVPRWVSEYRVGRLAKLVGQRLQRFDAANVLDVGCGLGRITAQLQRAFPTFTFRGIDIVVQPEAAIEVTRYDGSVIPFADKSMDVVLLLDVLHHADDPVELLQECGRVARSLVLVKDHVCETAYDWTRLASLDWLGNRPFDVPMRYAYFSRREWAAAFATAKVRCDSMETQITTCPPPFDLLLDSGVQVLVELSPEPG